MESVSSSGSMQPGRRLSCGGILDALPRFSFFMHPRRFPQSVEFLHKKQCEAYIRRSRILGWMVCGCGPEVDSGAGSMRWTMGGMEVVLTDCGTGGWQEFSSYLKRFLPGRRALKLGAFLCLLQALDGLLTMIGVSRFGIEVEGNPFIRLLMEEYGQYATLGLLKTFAVFVVVVLTFFTNRIPWLNHALGALSCAYLFMAIVPWTYLLFVQPLI